MTVGARVMVTSAGGSSFRGRFGRVVSVHPVSGTVTVRLMGHPIPVPFAASEVVKA